MGIALRNALRLPVRTLLGVVALTLGVGALTLVAAVTWAFHGEVTGTLLGNAVSIKARGVYLLAVLATALLSTVVVADVLYLNVQERRAELAALRATGWTDAALGRLVTYEGALIGAVGATLGAGLGLLAVYQLVGAASPDVVRTTVITLVIGVALATLAAFVPSVIIRSLPLAAQLAEE